MIVAPLLVVWFGFGIVPKLAIISLVCFFPVVVTTLDALASVDAEQRKLMRTLDAPRLQELRLVEAPAALPGALSGAKIAVAVAVIGAVFAEYAGSSEGLGNVILQATPQLETARAYAAVVAAGAARDHPLPPPDPGRAPARAVGPPRHRMEHPPMTRRALAVLLPILAAGLLGACSEKQETTSAPAQRELTLVLDYLPNPDHVGIYTAQANEEFAKAGLRVKIVTPVRPGGAAEARRRRARRPGDLLRAGDPARARAGRRRAERRRRSRRAR